MVNIMTVLNHQVVWHPTKDLLASASYDNSIKFFKEDQSDGDWVCCGTLKGHESTVWSISFNSNYNIL